MPNLDSTPYAQEQAQQGTPGAQEQAVQEQGGEQPSNQPQTPSVAEIQQQLASERQQREQAEENYKQAQAWGTRNAQALAALQGTNGQPPAAAQDPLAPYVERLSQNFPANDLKSLRALAQTQYDMAREMVAPLQTQIQQSYQALQGQALIEDAIAQSYRTDPELYPDQATVDAVRNQLRAYASQSGQITPETARMAAGNAYFAAGRHKGQQQQAAPLQPLPAPPQPFRHGMNGTYQFNPAFQPPTTSGQAPLPPGAQQAQDEIKARFNLK